MASRRKQLKQPDQFVSKGQQILDWVGERQNWVLGIVGGLMVLILVIYGGQSLLRKQLQTNYARLDKALRLAGAEVGPKAVSSLEELQKLDEEDAAPRFETEEEKWQAVRKALEEVRPKLSRETPKELAALYEGEAAFKLKDYESAIAAYGDYADMVKDDPFLRPVALYNLAVAKMNAGKFEEALADLEAARAGNDQLGAIGSGLLISKAICEARLGRAEDAKVSLGLLEAEYNVQADALGAPVHIAALSQGLPKAFADSLPPAPEPEESGKGEGGK